MIEFCYPAHFLLCSRYFQISLCLCLYFTHDDVSDQVNIVGRNSDKIIVNCLKLSLPVTGFINYLQHISDWKWVEASFYHWSLFNQDEGGFW